MKPINSLSSLFLLFTMFLACPRWFRFLNTLRVKEFTEIQDGETKIGRFYLDEIYSLIQDRSKKETT